MLDLRTYLVVGTSNTNGKSLADVASDALRAGISAIQIREKDVNGQVLDAGEFYKNAVSVSQILDEKTLLIINDRIDVALALHQSGYKVDGVHLGQSDLPPAIVSKIFHNAGWKDAVIGLSCRDENALENAAILYKEGAIHYIGMGPVHTTQSKPSMPVGLEYQRWGELRAFAKQNAPNLPVVAIGGITPSDAQPLKELGADGYCCISYIAGADDIYSAAKEFVSAFL